MSSHFEFYMFELIFGLVFSNSFFLFELSLYLNLFCAQQESRWQSPKVVQRQESWSQRCWKTEKSMIAQMAAEAATGGESHTMCEGHDGLDSPEYVDLIKRRHIFESIGSGWSKSRETHRECWSARSRTSDEFGTWSRRHQRSMSGHQQGDEVNKNYRSRYVVKEMSRGPINSLAAEFFCSSATAVFV